MELEEFYPPNEAAWRKWLENNYNLKKGVWLLFYNKSAALPTITWSKAVDIALCFGWIDSKKVKIDAQSYKQIFFPRKAKSGWSKINKEKVAALIEKGEMHSAGWQSIKMAQENGSWNSLDAVEDLILPEDLVAAFAVQPLAEIHFNKWSKSKRKFYLHQLHLAKTAVTRSKRIQEILNLLNI